MEDDLFSQSTPRGNARRPSGGKDNLFAWTVALLLLIGLALACWMATFYVFGHPEEPFSYRILSRLGKIEPPRQFELTAAPRGEFLTARDLFERYGNLPDFELQNQNRELLRNYVTNYTDASERIPYVIGTYRVMDAFALDEDDPVSPGVAALAQAVDMPGVLVEHLYTADASTVPVLRRMLDTGLDLQLKRTVDLAALVHVDKLPDGRMVFSVIPLIYGNYSLDNGETKISLQPPPMVNVEGKWPVFANEALQHATQKFAAYRKRHGMDPPSGKNLPTLAPVEKPDAPQPSGQPNASRPALPVVPPRNTDSPTPDPNATPMPAASAIPVVDDPEAATPHAATPKPTPTAQPTPPPTPTANTPTLPPTPTPAPSSPTAPLKPFLNGNTQPPTTTPTPAATTATPNRTSTAWPTYPPGRMPRGRLLDVDDATRMADRGLAGQRAYLQGDFVVTVSGGKRAVLRPQSGPLNFSIPGIGKKTRVIVDFPGANGIPPEGSSLSRGKSRPFQIIDVREDKDGTINIFAREVTSP